MIVVTVKSKYILGSGIIKYITFVSMEFKSYALHGFD